MNRDHRKIARTYEERNILASSISRVSQISQTDNELKQKLQAIDTSHKLSNKRIKNETRELKEILHGLQRELKVSKGINHGQYIPSQFEQPPRRSRRTTVSSVPSEDRKEVGFERDLQRSEERNSDDLARNRSGSFPPVSEARDEKKINDALDDKLAENKLDTQDDVFEEPGGEVIKVFIEQTKSAQQTNEWKNDEITLTARAQNKTELPSIEQENYPQRRISGTGNDPKRLAKSSPKEQQQDERKRSTSDVFRGRFATADTNYLDTSLSSSTRRTSQTQPRGEVGRGVNRLRPSIVEEFSSVPNQKEQRKTSLGMPPYPWQRKGSVGNRGDSPMAGHGSLGRLDSHDAEVVFDALPDYLGGRRLSVAQGRVRRISRGTGLPPLKEERVAQKKSLQGTRSAENWSDLSKCRYLRKEEQEISIDDIFDKK